MGYDNFLWAWAKMEHWPDPQFVDLLRTFIAGAYSTDPRHLSNVAWAVYKAGQAGHISEQVAQHAEAAGGMPGTCG